MYMIYVGLCLDFAVVCIYVYIFPSVLEEGRTVVQLLSSFDQSEGTGTSTVYTVHTPVYSTLCAAQALLYP
jgi:hypothetical protein